MTKEDQWRIEPVYRSTFRICDQCINRDKKMILMCLDE
jgi:hypothetical protein